MSKRIILATSNHPLFEDLKKVDATFYDLERDEVFENRSVYDEADIVFDFSLASRESKEVLLRHLNIEFKAPIITDLTCYWGDYFLENYDHIIGAVAGAFYSPTNTYEYSTIDKSAQTYIEQLFSEMNHSTLEVVHAGIAFTYPRTVSMIINEAYFALEDGLAEPKDIDTAMKFGVNYPLGPFEWGQKIGLQKIIMVLDELYTVTGDPRYRASRKLRLDASKGLAI